MRAVRYYGVKDIRIEDIPEPECKAEYVKVLGRDTPNPLVTQTCDPHGDPAPGADGYKVKPAFVGICGTDLHE